MTCSSCGAKILWALTEKGARIPVDPDPRLDGNLLLYRRPDGSLLARYLSGESAPPGQRRYVSHFVTCPNAKTHRKKKVSP